ncbi:MAG: Xaa-Pro peptidase family protein [Candidatus Lokiarchaeota archaeon]|nr:Xaa-Pro peptidase family protein [Candidatus Lokiarchaeota archaeon]
MEPIGFNKERTRNILEKHDIDVLIASTPVNVFYLTGLPTLHVAPNPILYVLYNQYPSLSLVRRDGEESLIMWITFRSVDKFSWVSDIHGIGSPKGAMVSLSDKIEEWGLSSGKIGYESLMPSYQSEYLRNKFSSATFMNGDQAFLDMRLIKSEEEVKRIKKSTKISEKAIMNMIEASYEGITDIELLQIARRTIVNEGAEGWDHLTMNLGPSDPEAPGVGTTLKAGDLNRYDIGTIWKGYVSDVSRELVIGQIPDGAGEVMNRMIKVQEFCEQNIHPGLNMKELYNDASKFNKSLTKMGRAFITGHSIGLECEETHLFSPMKKLDRPFEENMVLDIEVWQNFKNQGLVGIEDCYRITRKGCERLSSLDKNIFVK